MFKKILIIGCGLIGSSVLRAAINKKLSKKIFVFEKIKKIEIKLKELIKKSYLLKNLIEK